MTTTETTIRTKIAQILSPTRIVLAAGAEQGVQVGMEFIIYELSDPIFDPETKEPLGQLELHKGRVKVLHVQDKIATATTLFRKVYRRGLLDGIPPLVTTGSWIDEQEKLPIDKSVSIEAITDLTVKVGDMVRSVS